VSPPAAKEINRQLHTERIFPGTHRRRLHQQPWAELPDGAFVLIEETPALVRGDGLVEWAREGYGARRSRPRRGAAQVITPPASLAALRAGYSVQIDSGAR
jgi:hypothetical protein